MDVSIDLEVPLSISEKEKVYACVCVWTRVCVTVAVGAVVSYTPGSQHATTLQPLQLNRFEKNVPKTAL